MTSGSELLRMRVGSARARFLDEIVTTTLSQRELATRGQSAVNEHDLESELDAQISLGSQIRQRAQEACEDLASYVKLDPEIHRTLTDALAEASRHFRSLQQMLTDWMQRNTVIPAVKELPRLIRNLDDCRAELIGAWPEVFPGLELEKVTPALQELDQGKQRRLDAILSDLSASQ